MREPIYFVYKINFIDKHINAIPTSFVERIMTSLYTNHDIQEKLDCFHRKNRIPHIIFYGESGSGKKTTVFQFIKKIYNHQENNIKENVMFVNCAHGKGIKFIREELKFFAKTNVHFKSGIWFKLIVLINADFLTVDAQSALRRCIEQFSHNTRFFIVIENKNKLLPPIVSRFCEIYVPLATDGNKPVNLHTQKIKEAYVFANEIKLQRIETVSRLMREYKSVVLTPPSLLGVVNQLYNEGISSQDFVDWVEEPIRPTMQMYFSKIRLEYRCEKMLLLCLLYCYFFNQDIDLKTLSFM